MQCIVQFCQNIYKVATGITFYRFPSEEGLRAAWLKALGTQDTRLSDSAVVCSRHFLNEDFYVTESGVREICVGAIPSSVLVCMACLDTDSELLLLSKHKLLEAYELLTGNPCDVGNLQQTLCVQCAQTVRDFSRFREQSLRARSLMMHLLQTHGLVTMRHLELIKREGALKSESVTSPLEADDSELHMDSDNEDNLTAPEEEQLMREPVTSPLEADDRDSHMEHDTDNETAPEEDDNVEVKTEPASPSVEEEIGAFVAGVGLPSRRAAYNENKTRATEEADTTQRRERARATETSALHNRPSDSDDDTRTNIRNCVVVLYDIFKHPTFVSKQNESLMQTRQADCSCDRLNTDTARKDAQYRAASESEVDGKNRTGEKRFLCKICEFRSRYKSHFARHLKTHTGEKPFSCKLCKYKCIRSGSLVIHMRTHTGEKPFSCELCKYKCTYSSSLVKHMRTHTGEKPYACKNCEYKCADSSSLDRHSRTHSGEKPFSCELCKYKCTQSSSLVKHMRTHTGEKPYACKYCEFKCAESSSLVTHIRTHTGEKPFSCKLCKYRCARSNTLAKHMRTHTGEKPYACKYCEYKCADSSSLVRHTKTHTGEKPFSCKLSKYKGAESNALITHMKSHVGGN